MRKTTLFAISILLYAGSAAAESVTTRYGTVNIDTNSENFSGSISINGKSVKKIPEAISLQSNGKYSLGDQDIIPITDASSPGGRAPNFQYILVVKPNAQTTLYKHPHEAKKAEFNVGNGEFSAIYDNQMVIYDGNKFRSKKIDPNLFKPTSHLPLELCKGLYDIRGQIVDIYQATGQLDPYEFSRAAVGWIEELESYPFFSPEAVLGLGGKNDPYLENVSLEDFKNTVCVKPH